MARYDVTFPSGESYQIDSPTELSAGDVHMALAGLFEPESPSTDAIQGIPGLASGLHATQQMISAVPSATDGIASAASLLLGGPGRQRPNTATKNPRYIDPLQAQLDEILHPKPFVAPKKPVPFSFSVSDLFNSMLPNIGGFTAAPTRKAPSSGSSSSSVDQWIKSWTQNPIFGALIQQGIAAQTPGKPSILAQPAPGSPTPVLKGASSTPSNAIAGADVLAAGNNLLKSIPGASALTAPTQSSGAPGTPAHKLNGPRPPSSAVYGPFQDWDSLFPFSQQDYAMSMYAKDTTVPAKGGPVSRDIAYQAVQNKLGAHIANNPDDYIGRSSSSSASKYGAAGVPGYSISGGGGMLPADDPRNNRAQNPQLIHPLQAIAEGGQKAIEAKRAVADFIHNDPILSFFEPILNPLGPVGRAAEDLKEQANKIKSPITRPIVKGAIDLINPDQWVEGTISTVTNPIGVVKGLADAGSIAFDPKSTTEQKASAWFTLASVPVQLLIAHKLPGVIGEFGKRIGAGDTAGAARIIESTGVPADVSAQLVAKATRESAHGFLLEPTTKPVSEPPVTITGNEIAKGNSINDFRRNALQYFRDNLIGKKVVNDATGLEITIVGSGAKKATSRTTVDNKLSAVAGVPEMLKHAELETVVPDNRGRFKNIYYFKVPIRIGTRNFDAHLVVREAADGHFYYDHNLSSP